MNTNLVVVAQDRNRNIIARKAGTGEYLDNYLYWFRWLELDKHLSFEKQVEQMLISAN